MNEKESGAEEGICGVPVIIEAGYHASTACVRQVVV